jgi:hypothetical protein
MMKLLYIPTGNVFTLPDEEALKIMRSDRGNYKILDAGFVDEEEPVVLPAKTVKELVLQEEQEEEEPEVEVGPEDPTVLEPKSKLDIDSLDWKSVRALAMKVGLPGNISKKEMIAKLKEMYGE